MPSPTARDHAVRRIRTCPRTRPRGLALTPLALPAAACVLGLVTTLSPPAVAGGAVGSTASSVNPEASAATAATARRTQPRAARVLVISLDGLNPAALRRLGHAEAPSLWQLVDEGAATMNARAAVEQTETLPNHTAMVTGRRIDAARGGHGVTWNDERLEPATVHAAAGHRVRSVFTEVHRAHRSTAVFSTKPKLSLFERTWPRAVDHSTIRSGDDAGLVRAARSDLLRERRALTFVHLGAADVAGHRDGFMSAAYLDAVRELDVLVGRLVAPIRQRERLRGTVVVLTADHGGQGAGHYDPRKRVNYRIPFVVWGQGVHQGSLYRSNPAVTSPGTARVGYGLDPGPVRNGDVANLTLDLLGLAPVPGSELDAAQRLRVG